MRERVALVTGANGFVGRAVCARLTQGGWRIRQAVRGGSDDTDSGECVRVGDIGEQTDWSEALVGVAAVVHLAARVHVMRDTNEDPLSAFRAVNVRGTRGLAEQAVRAGVKRFVFVSSIKVNGEKTIVGRPFRPDDPPRPVDPYAVSKLEAEDALRMVCGASELESVIIRPPLMYGPGVKANFSRMMRWVHRGVPLPFASVRNQRSLLAVENLADLIAVVVEHPSAANQLFLGADGDDLSTPQLLRRLAAALGVRARLVPMPPSLMLALARVAGRGPEVERLCGSLQVDASRTRELLGWAPPFSVDQALTDTARAYLSGVVA